MVDLVISCGTVDGKHHWEIGDIMHQIRLADELKTQNNFN